MIERSARPAVAPALRHVAVIASGSPGVTAGRRLREIARAASRAGIAYLTVDGLGDPAALAATLDGFTDAAEPDDELRLDVIGAPKRLPSEARAALDRARSRASSLAGPVVTLTVAYGARREIAHGMRRLAEDVRGGRIAPEAIDDAVLERYLRTGGLPDPDLLVRTGGDLRLADFLLFELAYTELWATRTPWCDFTADDLSLALADFTRRQRRFGS